MLQKDCSRQQQQQKVLNRRNHVNMIGHNVLIPLVKKLARTYITMDYLNKAMELIRSCNIYFDALLFFGLRMFTSLLYSIVLGQRHNKK